MWHTGETTNGHARVLYDHQFVPWLLDMRTSSQLRSYGLGTCDPHDRTTWSFWCLVYAWPRAHSFHHPGSELLGTRYLFLFPTPSFCPFIYFWNFDYQIINYLKRKSSNNECFLYNSLIFCASSVNEKYLFF